MNGVGERCGNANLCSIIPAIKLKMKLDCISDERLARLRESSRYILELANIRTVSIGLVDPPSGENYDIRSLHRGQHYRKLVLKDGVLVGALLVGDIEGAGVYTGLIKRKIQVDPHMEALMAPRPSYANWLLTESKLGP